MDQQDILQMRSKEYTYLYTGGTFDLFHAGHVNFLAQCKEIAAHVTVALNSDDFVAQYKGDLILPYDQRCVILEGCKYVDEVIKHENGFNSKATIESQLPFVNCIAIGSDWENKDYFKQMGFDQKWLNDNNIDLVYLDYGSYLNTTRIKEKIRSKK